MAAFFSCLFVWPFTARYGRRWSLAAASLIFNVGAVLQLFYQHGIATWYAGRTISGIGAGNDT